MTKEFSDAISELVSISTDAHRWLLYESDVVTTSQIIYLRVCAGGDVLQHDEVFECLDQIYMSSTGGKHG